MTWNRDDKFVFMGGSSYDMSNLRVNEASCSDRVDTSCNVTTLRFVGESNPDKFRVRPLQSLVLFL